MKRFPTTSRDQRTAVKLGFFDSDIVRETFRKDYEKQPLNVQENFAGHTGHLMAQLEAVFEKLEMASHLVNTHHRSLELKGFSRAMQFFYQVENYLSTMYVFDQRFKKVLRHLEKWAGKTKSDATVQKSISRLRRITNASLQDILTLRGNHVHDRNFITEDFYRLELYDVVGTFETSAPQRHLYHADRNDQHRQLKKQWKTIIDKNNTACAGLLGMLYELLASIHLLLYQRIQI